MPIDSSIAMGYQPIKLENPMNSLAQMMQIQGAQKQNQLADLTMQQHQLAIDETNKLNALYAGAINPDGTIDRSKLFANAATGGLGARIPGLQKGFLEADEAQGKVDKQKVDLVDAKLKQSRQFLDGVQTPEEYLAWHQGNHADPVLGPLLAARGVTVDSARKKIDEALQKPGGLQSLIQQSALGLDKFTEMNKPTIHTVDSGQVSTMYAVPGLGGAPTALNTTQKVATPDATLSATTSTENNKRSVNASLENAKATRDVASATRDAANTKRDQDTEMKLGDDYRAQSKDFKTATDAYRQINATLDQATKSPAATLAAATKFMKILDPGSVVRESELGMALAATGVIDRAQNYINTLQSGKILTESQVKDFRKITGDMYEAAKGVQKQIDADYTSKAKAYKLRPENIVQNLGQNDGAPKTVVKTGTTKDGKKVVKYSDGTVDYAN